MAQYALDPEPEYIRVDAPPGKRKRLIEPEEPVIELIPKRRATFTPTRRAPPIPVFAQSGGWKQTRSRRRGRAKRGYRYAVGGWGGRTKPTPYIGGYRYSYGGRRKRIRRISIPWKQPGSRLRRVIVGRGPNRGNQWILGHKRDVYKGNAHVTPGGLVASQLMVNPRGKIVSIKQRNAALNNPALMANANRVRAMF